MATRRTSSPSTEAVEAQTPIPAWPNTGPPVSAGPWPFRAVRRIVTERAGRVVRAAPIGTPLRTVRAPRRVRARPGLWISPLSRFRSPCFRTQKALRRVEPSERPSSAVLRSRRSYAGTSLHVLNSGASDEQWATHEKGQAHPSKHPRGGLSTSFGGSTQEGHGVHSPEPAESA